jgi:hypothetical protein
MIQELISTPYIAIIAGVIIARVCGTGWVSWAIFGAIETTAIAVAVIAARKEDKC